MRILTQAEQWPYRVGMGGLPQQPTMNLTHQQNKLRQRADNARRAGDHELGDYFDYLHDKMTADAAGGRSSPASAYIPMAQEEFGDERVERITHG